MGVKRNFVVILSKNEVVIKGGKTKCDKLSYST